MKISNSIIKIFILFLILSVWPQFGCRSNYVVDNSYPLSTINKMGIIIRTPKSVRISQDEYAKNTSDWISGYKQLKKIGVISNADEKLTSFNSDHERFYQSTEDGAFLKYKSIGVINNYLREHGSDLKKIIKENGFNGLLIYEVYGITATEMQFIDYEYVIVIADEKLDVQFIYHNTDKQETIEFDHSRIKQKLLDTISNNLIEKLVDLDFLRR